MAARVSYGSGANVIDCTIRNISDGGAKLQISGSITLPEEFDMFIPQRNVSRRVRLCWRSDEFCGVAFLDKGEDHSHSEELVSTETETSLRLKIRQLETTIAQMQRRIDELTGG